MYRVRGRNHVAGVGEDGGDRGAQWPSTVAGSRPSVPMMIAVVTFLVSAMFSGASRTAPR